MPDPLAAMNHLEMALHEAGSSEHVPFLDGDMIQPKGSTGVSPSRAKFYFRSRYFPEKSSLTHQVVFGIIEVDEQRTGFLFSISAVCRCVSSNIEDSSYTL